MAGVSVRTLHHYDDIGLLVPSRRTGSGYRLYDDADLERLQEVLFFREIGFELAAIRRMMSDPGYDRTRALERQRELLAAREDHIRAMIQTIDISLDHHRRGIRMNDDDMFEVFGDFDVRAHTQEAGERWPGEAFEESQRRTGRYTKEQWQAAMAEADAIAADFAAALSGGMSPADVAVGEIAERHRLHVDRWFFPCPPEMHAQLGDLYVDDERFAQYWNRREPGLNVFVRDAFRANAARSTAT